MSWQIHTPHFKPISQKTVEKSLENYILAKGNKSCKSRSSVTKLELDPYYAMTNSYTKFQVNISKDSREKSGKLKCDGRTDGQTDGQTASKPRFPPASRWRTNLLQIVLQSGQKSISWTHKTLLKRPLILSLPIFWQFFSLSATFILTRRGILESQAYMFSKIVIFLHFLTITLNKYPKFKVSKSRILWKLHNVGKQMDLNKVRGSKSPIGDFGSEIVKEIMVIPRKE